LRVAMKFFENTLKNLIAIVGTKLRNMWELSHETLNKLYDSGVLAILLLRVSTKTERGLSE
jgi:hypothetical protein